LYVTRHFQLKQLRDTLCLQITILFILNLASKKNSLETHDSANTPSLKTKTIAIDLL